MTGATAPRRHRSVRGAPLPHATSGRARIPTRGRMVAT